MKEATWTHPLIGCHCVSASPCCSEFGMDCTDSDGRIGTNLTRSAKHSKGGRMALCTIYLGIGIIVGAGLATLAHDWPKIKSL